MRKRLVLVSLLVLSACEQSKARPEGVDTTLPAGTMALAGDASLIDDNTMFTDMNTTDGMDGMTDNMTAVDSMSALDGSGDYAMPSYDDTTPDSMTSDAVHGRSDDSSGSNAIPTDPFANTEGD